jgi:hypothetical protein
MGLQDPGTASGVTLHRCFQQRRNQQQQLQISAREAAQLSDQ